VSEYEGGDLTVEIEWTETTSYKATVTIPAEDFKQWWHDEVPPGSELSDGWVQEFLENNDDDVWVNQIDFTKAGEAVLDRTINEVKDVTEHEDTDLAFDRKLLDEGR
jgi:hypothetical protein